MLSSRRDSLDLHQEHTCDLRVACQRSGRYKGVDDKGDIEPLTRGSRLRDDAPPTRSRRSAAPSRNPTRAVACTASPRRRKRLITLVEIAARGMRCVVTIDDWRQGRAVFTADDQRIDGGGRHPGCASQYAAYLRQCWGKRARNDGYPRQRTVRNDLAGRLIGAFGGSSGH